MTASTAVRATTGSGVQNGNSSVWGGAGSDRLFLGNGDDHVWGGGGNDRISLGRGRDHIWGGAGKDKIRAGNGNDGCGAAPAAIKMYVGNASTTCPVALATTRPGLVVYVNGGRGRDMAYVNTFGMRYARAHGVEAVRKIRTRTL